MCPGVPRVKNGGVIIRIRRSQDAAKILRDKLSRQQTKLMSKRYNEKDLSM